jgi:hypothetical protein
VTSLSTAQLQAVADVACPRCHLAKGTPCGGDKTPRRAPHPERVEFAKQHQRELVKLKTWGRA